MRAHAKMVFLRHNDSCEDAFDPAPIARKPRSECIIRVWKKVWTVAIATDINSEVFKVVVSGDNDPVLIKPFPPPGVTLKATDPEAMMLKQAHYYLGSDVDKYPSRLALWCSHRAVMLWVTVVVIPTILAHSYARAP